VRALSESARTRTVVISDLDPLVEAEDVTKALVDQFAVKAESVKLRSLRPPHRDTQTAVVGLPSKDAEAVLCKGKIRLGWSICKVKERDSQPRCYKCLEIRHIAIKCHSKVDRSGCCIKCGKTGHKIAQCPNESVCFICTEGGPKSRNHQA